MAGESTSIIIFGGTGDLARRKLLPALFQLACKERLPENFRIVGFARRENSDDKFRELMGDSVLRRLGDDWERPRSEICMCHHTLAPLDP